MLRLLRRAVRAGERAPAGFFPGPCSPLFGAGARFSSTDATNDYNTLDRTVVIKGDRMTMGVLSPAERRYAPSPFLHRAPFETAFPQLKGDLMPGIPSTRVHRLHIHASTRLYGPGTERRAHPAPRPSPPPAGAHLVAVARTPFLRDGDPAPPVTALLRQLEGSGEVALASSLFTPPGRLLVDLYAESPSAPGELWLQSGAMDILEALQLVGAGRRARVVPDVSDVPPAAAPWRPQSSQEVLMVAPSAFAFNDEAAQDNKFMHHREGDHSAGATRTVLREYAGLIGAVRDRARVRVHLFEHAAKHGTPDACFPNNWFSTHPHEEVPGPDGGGTLVLYPLKCENRRRERREEIVSYLKSLQRYTRTVDLTEFEERGMYFEGTGSLVLDRARRVAYVALSERSHPEVAERWAAETGYELVTFRAMAAGAPIYHTNVMMAIGTSVAVVCAESVEDPAERGALMERLGRHHEVVEITPAQMGALVSPSSHRGPPALPALRLAELPPRALCRGPQCGNVLEVRGMWGEPLMAMSTQSYNAFTEDQRAALRRHVTDLVHAPIDTLEDLAGGGVRCTLGEVMPRSVKGPWEEDGAGVGR